MPKTPKKPQRVHTHLGLKLTDHSVSAGAGINHAVHDPRLRHDETPVYSFSTSIEFVAVATYPEDRLEQQLILSVYGDQADMEGFSQVLGDRHARAEDGEPEYRKLRGQLVPVYDLPKGIGYLEKVRGQQSWRGAAWIPPQMVTDMLILLVGNRPLYLSLHELKVARRRWIVGLTLQTTDPAEE